MNHTIIKKALNEALTQKYYDELMSGEDEEHIFSVGFTADMKRLIRKTDDKLLYYSKYVAIAACACIAVGCAVLLPNLINSGIRTEPVETTPVTEISTTPSEDTNLPIIITTTEATTTATVTTPPNETTTPESATETTTTEATTTETTTPPVTTTEEKVTEITTTPVDTDDKPADDAGANGDVIVDVEDDGDQAPPEIEEGDDAVIDGDIVVEEDDAEIEDDEDVSTDVDDDVEVDIEEDEVVEDEDDTPLRPITADTLGGAIAEVLFDNPAENIDGKIYTNKLIYMVANGDTAGSLYNLYAKTQNLDFVTEFILKNKDNPVPAEAREEDYWNDHLIIEIADGSSGNLTFHDYSNRNDYETLFSGDDEVDAEEDEMGDFTQLIRLTVYQGGVIGVSDHGYSTAYYEADTSELFEKLEAMEFSKVPETVGDVISDFNITADNIYKAYSDIRSYYDINFVNARFDTDSDKAMLISFLEKIKDKKLTVHTEHINEYDSCDFRISFKNGGGMRMLAYKGKLHFADRIEAPEKWYSTPITQSELEELITLACKAENLAEPSFYHTFDEYREQVKYMTGISNVYINEYQSGVSTSYKITDSEKLKALYDFIMTECKSAEYMPYAEYGNGKKSFFVEVNGAAPLLFNDADEIRLLGNIFQCPAGTYDRVMGYIKNNSTISAEEYMEEDAVVEEDDTDEFEFEDEIEIDE